MTSTEMKFQAVIFKDKAVNRKLRVNEAEEGEQYKSQVFWVSVEDENRQPIKIKLTSAQASELGLKLINAVGSYRG